MCGSCGAVGRVRGLSHGPRAIPMLSAPAVPSCLPAIVPLSAVCCTAVWQDDTGGDEAAVDSDATEPYDAPGYVSESDEYKLPSADENDSDDEDEEEASGVGEKVECHETVWEEINEVRVRPDGAQRCVHAATSHHPGRLARFGLGHGHGVVG